MPAASDSTVSFSALSPSILEREGRLRIGRQILNVLEHHLQGQTLAGRRVLDIGCSSGIITDLIASRSGAAIGIDVDRAALAQARETHHRDRLEFRYMSGDALEFPNASFDIVICNQVYYWFEDVDRLFAEIARVLTPGGLCFFAAVNKFKPWESQYQLPLLPILPRRAADLMVRAAGKGERFACYYRSIGELRKSSRELIVHRYTPKLLKDPEAFGFSRLSAIGRVTRHLPLGWLERLEGLSPNIIWVLEKPRSDRGSRTRQDTKAPKPENTNAG